jgi:predicted HTH domain antitoxin
MDIQAEALSALRRSPEEFASEMRLAAAIYWYLRGEIAQGKATQIAGISRVTFIDELSRRRVPAFQAEPEDLKKELLLLNAQSVIVPQAVANEINA